MDVIVGLIQSLILIVVLGLMAVGGFALHMSRQDKMMRKYAAGYIVGALAIAGTYAWIHHAVTRPRDDAMPASNPSTNSSGATAIGSPGLDRTGTATFTNFRGRGDNLTVKCTGPTGNVTCKSVR